MKITDRHLATIARVKRTSPVAKDIPDVTLCETWKEFSESWASAPFLWEATPSVVEVFNQWLKEEK